MSMTSAERMELFLVRGWARRGIFPPPAFGDPRENRIVGSVMEVHERELAPIDLSLSDEESIAAQEREFWLIWRRAQASLPRSSRQWMSHHISQQRTPGKPCKTAGGSLTV